MVKIDPRKLGRRQKIALVGLLSVVLIAVALLMWQTRPQPSGDTAPYELAESVKLDNADEAGAITEVTAEYYESTILGARGQGAYLVLAHNTSCPAGMPLTSTVKDLAHEYGLKIYGLMQDEFRKSTLAKEIKFLPSLAVIYNGRVVAYLDAESDADLSAYKSLEGLTEWLKRYVKL